MEEPVADGYLRFPAISGDTVVFVSEDDLWTVPVAGGTARRLTADLAAIKHPAVSPDGSWIAFTSDAEGDSEVYVMAAGGGPARRLTWLGDVTTTVSGFTPDGRVVFTSAAGQPFPAMTHAYAVSPEGGHVRGLPYGRVGDVAYGPGGAVVVGRNTADPARWKRYRGGRAGRLWIDPDGSGAFQRLLADLDSNLASPMWIGERIYFLSDHEGVGNIYSCAAGGGDLRRHTDHDTYYARWASTDGRRVVYQHAAQLRLLDPEVDRTTTGTADSQAGPSAPLPVRLAGPRTGRQRHFVHADEYLGDVALHPRGHSIVADVRGKLVSFPCWEEAVRQHGAATGVRYRQGCYLGDGERVCAVSDADGEDGVDVFELAPGGEGRSRRLATGRLGRVERLRAAPDGERLAVANHRRELLLVDVATGAVTVLDESPADEIGGLAWSPDGAWIAYSYPASPRTSCIRLAEVVTGAVHDVTTPRFRDEAPDFDPSGRYLYFLSSRTFDPVSDALQFEWAFPKGWKPYLVTLRADLASPFTPTPRAPGAGQDNSSSGEASPGTGESGTDTAGRPSTGERGEPPTVSVDLRGIESRVVAFPVPEARYTRVVGLAEKVLLTREPVAGELGNRALEAEARDRTIEAYDFTEREHSVLVDDGGPVTVSSDRATMLYQTGHRVRVLPAGTKPDDDADKETPGRKSGWVDLDRVRVAIVPAQEWHQMLAETWRLQRDQFWVPDMSGVAWKEALERYLPLAERVATRAELSDLIWEMQGELGTSHAYEIGGDYRPTAAWMVGQLAADLTPDDAGRWRVGHIVHGDSWDDSATSPLAAPGIRVEEGDTILAVGGQPVPPDTGPAPLLTHQAGQTVELTVGDADGGNPRRAVVTTLGNERPARYREWVENNRARIHRITDGRVGYIHIPDMTPNGFAEFHRAYLAEVGHEALVVDVRYNGGGNVSALLLEKLARRRVGYEISRWNPPEAYPTESPAGPLVCVSNECAGSDGDIFTHGFRMFGLGPIVGARTWGGVIGINPSRRLADGTLATQPEYSFWFDDVGWGVENHGAEPDVPRDISPQEHAAGLDPQLDAAVELVRSALSERESASAPDPASRPDRGTPGRLRG